MAQDPAVLVSLILTFISFIGWIIYTIGWSIAFNTLSKGAIFIPLWLFLASGPLVFISSVLRDVSLLSKDTYKRFGVFIITANVILLAIYFISGTVMLVESLVIFIIVASYSTGSVGVVFCIGACIAYGCECVACGAGIYAVGRRSNKQQPSSTPQVVVQQPMVLQPVFNLNTPMFIQSQPHLGQITYQPPLAVLSVSQPPPAQVSMQATSQPAPHSGHTDVAYHHAPSDPPPLYHDLATGSQLRALNPNKASEGMHDDECEPNCSYEPIISGGVPFQANKDKEEHNYY